MGATAPIMPEVSPAKRIVEVDKHWYAQLMEYLLPTERWTPREGSGVMLFVQHFDGSGVTQLVFVPTDEERR